MTTCIDHKHLHDDAHRLIWCQTFEPGARYRFFVTALANSDYRAPDAMHEPRGTATIRVADWYSARDVATRFPAEALWRLRDAVGWVMLTEYDSLPTLAEAVKHAIAEAKKAPTLPPWQVTFAEFSKAYPAHKSEHTMMRDQNGHLREVRGIARGPLDRFVSAFQQDVTYFHPLAPGRGFKTSLEARRDAHRQTIAKALARGLPVPASVLHEYPDLAPRKNPRRGRRGKRGVR